MEQFKEKEKEEETKKVKYNDKEKAYRSFLIERMISAKNQRDGSYTELDDMDYVTYYDRNKKAANAYLRPKKDQEDIRIVTGTTHEKELSLLSAMLQYNFEADIEPHDDKGVELKEVGDTMQDVVRKSRYLEDYDKKRVLFYKELLDQGTAFYEETFEEKTSIKKTLEGITPEMDPDKIGITDKVKKLKGECEVNVLDGRHVYLGNIKEFELKKQPYLFTIDKIPYSSAERKFGKWARWKYVPKKIEHFGELDNYEEDEGWTLLEQNENMVEVVRYQDANANDFMIMLNGVMMLPVGFPIPTADGDYSVVKGDIEPISPFFAYSKSIPAKTKVDQAVLDQTLRMIILLMQKSWAPPLANNTGRKLSRKIFLPGVITDNIDPEEIAEIGENKGPGSSHIAGYELLKRIIDQKSVQPTFSGESVSDRQTATEILELKKQSMMKMGTALWGILNLESGLNKKRLFNIIKNWTKAYDQKYDSITNSLRTVYRQLEVEKEIGDRGLGTRIIRFTENQKSPKRIKAEEVLKEAVKGEPVEIKEIDVKKLAQTIDFTWKINIVPTEKDSDELKQTLWFQKAQSYLALFGPESMNMEYLKYRSAVVGKEDYNKLFKRGVPAMPQEMQSRQANGQSSSPAKRSEQMSRGTMAPVNQRQPSLNKQANV